MIKACLIFDYVWSIEEIVRYCVEFDKTTTHSVIGKKLTFARVDDGYNETVDTEDTSHDTGNEGLEDQARPENTNGADPDAGSRGSVSSAHVCEDEGGSETHLSEECPLVDGLY